jgi:hypothetical protein
MRSKMLGWLVIDPKKSGPWCLGGAQRAPDRLKIFRREVLLENSGSDKVRTTWLAGISLGFEVLGMCSGMVILVLGIWYAIGLLEM